MSSPSSPWLLCELSLGRLVQRQQGVHQLHGQAHHLGKGRLRADVVTGPLLRHGLLTCLVKALVGLNKGVEQGLGFGADGLGLSRTGAVRVRPVVRARYAASGMLKSGSLAAYPE